MVLVKKKVHNPIYSIAKDYVYAGYLPLYHNKVYFDTEFWHSASCRVRLIIYVHQTCTTNETGTIFHAHGHFRWYILRHNHLLSLHIVSTTTRPDVPPDTCSSMRRVWLPRRRADMIKVVHSHSRSAHDERHNTYYIFNVGIYEREPGV